MPLTITWFDITIRLLLTVLAAGIIGFNRDERGHSAGLRTNLLVALAACIAMIQANLLTSTTGKASDSFVVMDTMRLPLGILSGIGFIGAGAILKRGEMIVGVTTAATLWFVTVMGLCFGGGQLALGIAAFALGFAILTGLRGLENEMSRQQSGTLTLSTSDQGPTSAQIESLLKAAGISYTRVSIRYEPTGQGRRQLRWKLQWKAHREESDPPFVLRELEALPEIQMLEFTR